MSSPSSQSLLPRLMAIADTLEADTSASPPAFRETLLRATHALCEDQGLVATPSQIEQAVDAHLAAPAKTTSVAEVNVVDYDFGWNRPRSTEAVRQELRQMDRWPRRCARLGLGVRTLRSPLGFLALGLVTAAGVAWPIVQGIAGEPSTWLLSLGWGCLLDVWIRDIVRSHALAPAPALEIKEQIEWRHWFVARDYVRHALAASGDLTNGDIAQVRARMRRRAREIQQDSALAHRHRQIEEMAQW